MKYLNTFLICLACLLFVACKEEDDIASPNINPETDFLPGTFTIALNKQVKFTRTNLYWNGSKYMFEQKSIDYPSYCRTDHVGHFNWTRKASEGIVHYYAQQDVNNMTNDTPFFSEKRNNLFVLTKAEWQYLLYVRPNAEKLYKSGVTVGSTKYCLIIAPDDYTASIKSSYNEYEVEALGLVCLPPAGKSDFTGVHKKGEVGAYWTATPNAQKEYFAELLYFDWQQCTFTSEYRDVACSLRLVQLIQPKQ